MSGQNVIPFHTPRRARSAVVEERTIAALVFVTFAGMMFAGMVSAFIVVRATAGSAWPPAGQPWFPLAQTAVTTAALLVSGGLVFLAGRAWEKREGRVGTLLLAAIVLGALFLFFQGVAWIALIRQGLTLTSSHHGNFFCLIVGMHSVNALGTLMLLGVAWSRLGRGSLSRGTFSAARILWYFVVGAWPVLLLCLYQ